jgi:hypothetical protein
MSNYNVITDWDGKDALADSNPAKVISGDEFQDEFDAIATAISTKANINGSATETFSALSLSLDGTTVTSTAAELNLLDGITAVNDEDDMSSDSATALATQQSIKAYVDNNTPVVRTPVITAETEIFSTTSTTDMAFTKYSFAKTVTNNQDVGYFHIEASATRAPTGNIHAIVKVANSSGGTAFVQAEAVGYGGSRDDAANTTRSESYAFLNLSEDPSNSSNWAVWISWAESNTLDGTREGRVAVCGYM